jgi:hypothetical protein
VLSVHGPQHTVVCAMGSRYLPSFIIAHKSIPLKGGNARFFRKSGTRRSCSTGKTPPSEKVAWGLEGLERLLILEGGPIRGARWQVGSRSPEFRFARSSIKRTKVGWPICSAVHCVSGVSGMAWAREHM